MTRQILHLVTQNARPATVPGAAAEGGPGPTWRSVADLPFAAQEAVFAVRGAGAAKKKKKGDEKAATGPEATNTLVAGTTTEYTNDLGAGSALIVTSSPAATTMFDAAAPTKRFVELLEAHPDRPPLILWSKAIRDDPNVGGEAAHVLGTAEPKTASGGRRIALIVGNGDYAAGSRFGDLPEAQPDAAALAGAYRGGWTVDHLENASAVLVTAKLDAIRASAAPGDEVFISLHGHGVELGFAGVDGHVVPWAWVAELAAAAVSGGWSCTIVADACHSGRLQHYVAGEPGNAVSSEDVETLGHGEGTFSKSLAVSEASHAKRFSTKMRYDTPSAALERLGEQLAAGNDAQLYAQLEAVAQAFERAADHKSAYSAGQAASLREDRHTLVALRGHARLADAELQAVYRRSIEAAYRLRKKIAGDARAGA